MKQIRKRIGSLLLSVFVALPMLPATVFAASEAFSLPTGQTYYFDLSGEVDHIGTINAALPDATLHYVPFTYAGTINAYSLDSLSINNPSKSENTSASDRNLFVADYALSHSVSWNTLHENDLIYGKAYDTNYILRSLSMGNTTGAAGSPTNNEWDRILDKDVSSIKDWSIRSYGQDSQDWLGYRIARGGSGGIRYAIASLANSSGLGYGFRPALEVLSAGDLGADGLLAVTLNLGGGSLDSKSSIQVISAGGSFIAPSSAGLTPPDHMAFVNWHVTGEPSTTYEPGQAVAYTAGLGLTANWEYDPEPENKPEIEIDYDGEKLTGFVAGDSYTIDSASVAPVGSMLDVAGYMGTSITIVKTGNGTSTTDSDAQELVIPARPAVPTATGVDPTTFSGTGKITGVTTEMEYKASAGAWTDVAGTEIDSLAVGTYQVRVKATAVSFRSEEQTISILAPDAYTVTIGNSGTGASGAGSYVSGETVAIDAGNRAGYFFAGWISTDGVAFASANSPSTTFAMPARNVTVYAQWTEETYTVTFDKNGGDVDANPTVKTAVYGGNVGTLPTSPTWAGYTFSGWNTGADGDGDPFNTTTAVIADMIVYAQWTADPTYNVTYNGNGNTGGSVPHDNRLYLQGATVTIQGNTGSLTRSGYTFAGWNTQDDGKGTSYAAGSTFTMESDDVTLYVEWTVNEGGSSGGGFSSLPSPSCDTKVISTDGKLTLPACRAGEVSLGEAVTVIIPAGASDKDMTLTIEKVSDSEQLLKERDMLASPIYEIFKNYSEDFKKTVTLIFAFEPSDLKENQVPVVFYYDETEQEWVEVKGGKIEGNRIAVGVNHFTKFAVFAVDQAAAAPEKPEITFSDIAGHWAEALIKQAAGDGIVGGYPDGTFRPNNAVTRAEFTVMLMNTLKPQGEGVTLTFSDTAKIGSWAQKAVAQAVQAEIIKGYEDGTFRPDAEITRAEMTMMLANATRLSLEATAATGFADDRDIPAWAKDAVSAIKKLGLIQGKSSNDFDPNASTTRAEAVTVLMRMLAQKS